MGLLTIEEIKDADDKRTVDVSCPEWGGEVRLRSLTGDERDNLEFWSTKTKRKNDSRGFRAKLISMSAVTDSGDHLFNGEATALLGTKNAAVVERLFSAAMKLAGLSNEDVEVLEKNSDEALDSDSG